MDNLRLILLIIGCLVVLGIYLWEIFFKTESRKSSDILDAVDDMPDSPLMNDVAVPVLNNESLNPQGYDNFSDSVADLGSLLAQSRNESVEASPQIGSIQNIASEEKEDELPLQMSVKDYESSLGQSEASAEMPVDAQQDMYQQENDSPYIDSIENADTETDIQSEEAQEQQEQEAESLQQQNEEPPSENQSCDDLLVLYITSRRSALFNGLLISKAAEEVGMIYGHMNVFHHFGPGKLHSGQPLFSMANMYEPGSFDLGRMADLKTKGVTMFMYSPASIDANIVFELFLNTSQRIAEMLGGDVRTADNELLTSSSIKSLREKAEALSAQ